MENKSTHGTVPEAAGRVRPRAYVVGIVIVVVMVIVQVFLGCFNNFLAHWSFTVNPYITIFYTQINLLFFYVDLALLTVQSHSEP